MRLSSGLQIEAALPEGGAQTGRVTIVIRPEHTRLVAGASGSALSGKLENIVYFGTDTHYHVRLADGSQFIVRMQNARGSDEVFEPGGAVGIQLGKSAAQVLRD